MKILFSLLILSWGVAVGILIQKYSQPKCTHYKVEMLDIHNDTVFWLTDIDTTYKVGDTMNLDGVKFQVLTIKNHK